jgi:hypothetical protein
MATTGVYRREPALIPLVTGVAEGFEGVFGWELSCETEVDCGEGLSRAGVTARVG